MIEIGSQNAPNIENIKFGDSEGDGINVDTQNAPNIENFEFDTADEDGIDINVQDAQNINNYVVGTPEDDRLKGEKSDGKNVDILVGIDGQDVLVGNKGSDLFLLGRTKTVTTNVNLGIEKGVFYDEAGNDDYALIKKFDSDQDTIELVGKKSDYSLGATSGDLPEGTGIFKGDELLAIIEGQSDLALKDSYFEVS
jgi:hypothetical protein